MIDYLVLTFSHSHITCNIHVECDTTKMCRKTFLFFRFKVCVVSVFLDVFTFAFIHWWFAIFVISIFGFRKKIFTFGDDRSKFFFTSFHLIQFFRLALVHAFVLFSYVPIQNGRWNISKSVYDGCERIHCWLERFHRAYSSFCCPRQYIHTRSE